MEKSIWKPISTISENRSPWVFIRGKNKEVGFSGCEWRIVGDEVTDMKLMPAHGLYNALDVEPIEYCNMTSFFKHYEDLEQRINKLEGK